MTFVKLALCVACIAGLGLVIYSGNGGAWLNARLMKKRESTPPTTSALFATIPADVLISATGRVELTRMPFAEFNPHGNSTERAQARLEQARATNARNQARSPRAPSPGARREAGARTRVGSYWAAGASHAGRPAPRRTATATERRARRFEESRRPLLNTTERRQQPARDPLYAGPF